MPNIRPNCPPPKRPIVEPGGISVFMHSNLKRSGTHGKNSRIQEFKNSRVKEFRSSGVQEANTDGCEQILASNTLLIGWKPMNNQPQGRHMAAPFCNS